MAELPSMGGPGPCFPWLGGWATRPRASRQWEHLVPPTCGVGPWGPAEHSGWAGSRGVEDGRPNPRRSPQVDGRL